MPASQQLTPEQNVDLVHFILSLSDEQTREATILRRRRVVARRVEQLPQDSGDAAWQDIPAVAINLTPLWWRDDFDPVHDVVQIQAAHDGRQVALRLSWPDATQNSRALGTTEFEDGIAVELFRRDRSAAPADSTGGEPFLGMGMADAAVDLWYWDADRQTAADVIQAAYPRSVVDLYPLSEKVVETAELDRPGARAESQPPISLPAVATGNPIVPSKGGPTASTLTAAGPGTVTFRLPASQLVQARGQWRDGRWQVVMRRVLAPSGPDQGIALEPGVPLSLAIAVWDGAHGDRDGQKLISIWQDLELQ